MKTLENIKKLDILISKFEGNGLINNLNLPGLTENYFNKMKQIIDSELKENLSKEDYQKHKEIVKKEYSEARSYEIEGRVK